MRILHWITVLLGVALAGCAGSVEVTEARDSGATSDVDAGDDAGPVVVDSGVRLDAGIPDAGKPPPADDAEIVSATFPNKLGCTETLSAAIKVKNTGTATWPAGGDFKLGAVDDSDPFTSAGRVYLTSAVPPGGTYDFAVPLKGTGASGTAKTDWRMVHEAVRWFGAIAAHDVQVDCPPLTDFDLSKVTIVASPDVRSFAVTSQITSLEFKPDTIHIDHTKRGQWPGVVIDPVDGTTQEATIWVFFKINGAWYGTGGERLRPSQNEKQLSKASDIGPGWLYDSNRWGVMTNYVPQVGELVGFMIVAGSTRSDNQTPVHERTGVALIPFPPDGVLATFPPFFWKEP